MNQKEAFKRVLKLAAHGVKYWFNEGVEIPKEDIQAIKRIRAVAFAEELKRNKGKRFRVVLDIDDQGKKEIFVDELSVEFFDPEHGDQVLFAYAGRVEIDENISMDRFHAYSDCADEVGRGEIMVNRNCTDGGDDDSEADHGSEGEGAN